MVKTVLKLLVGLVAGCLIGLGIGGLIVVMFTDTTWSQYIDKYYNIDLSEVALAFLVGVFSLILSLAVIVPAHELGHLVCGLASGYKFVSYRIFNYTIIKEDGLFHIKKFGVAGTGGQCLLVPPDIPIDKIPTGWYNFGGILVNLMLLVIGLPLFALHLNPLVTEALCIFLLTDLIFLLMNAIPIGAGNDGDNLRILRKSPLGKLGFVNQLRANALIQNGIRPKDMPAELFCLPDNVDYKSSLEVSIPLMHASRLLDEMRYQEALNEMETLYSHKDQILPIYVKEIECELIFLYLATGEPEKARGLLDADLRKYVESYRKMMSSKERLLFAIALLIDEDEAAASEIYEGLLGRKNDYLLQGEVKSDIALMADMKRRHEGRAAQKA